ncbi:MAG: hypothetical protein GF418_04815 [Chitinivibrionales bacterium]|nr:hypothetical protein [Chitinivibrionales bacterium]MBD3394931.1 hypothetical protein [Chitinivibrionales bacterium]
MRNRSRMRHRRRKETNRIMKAMRFSALLFTVLILSAAAKAAPKKEVEAKAKELDVLKQYLLEARDSLQYQITERWRLKQRYVEQKEIDKEQTARLRELQERTFSELSRIKEEVFSKQRQLEDERKEVELVKDDWTYVVATFDEAFDKEAQGLVDVYPLEMEQRRKDLEALRREFKQHKNPVRILPKVLAFQTKYLEKGMNAIIRRQVVMPDDGEPQEMNVISFGKVFAYAINDRGDPYIIRQTGKLGSDRYAIEKVGAEELRAHLQEQLPVWIEQAELTGDVTVDVMQDDNTGILVSGKKVQATTRIVSWLKAGGPVMFPLIALMVWALILVILKLVQFSAKDKANRDLYDTVAGMLKNKEYDKAHDYAQKKKGVVAKVVTRCLEHSKWNRPSAEKAVRETLVEEVPQLEKHLATLAVIAGAAPLCGLLGTVTGMINLFQVITHYGTGDPKILAGGISEALITTQTGLSVAIPILLIHNALRNRSLHIQSEMEKHAIRILNRLWPEA